MYALADRNLVVVDCAAMTVQRLVALCSVKDIHGSHHSMVWQPIMHSVYSCASKCHSCRLKRSTAHGYYWALRSGGGGSYGMIMDVTLREFDGPTVGTLSTFVIEIRDT